MADLLTKPLPEDEFTKFKNRILGKAVNISTYLQGSVRKPEVMRTRARKEREYKNGANIWKANNCTHRAICESEYHNDDDKIVNNADEVKTKPKSRKDLG